MEIFAAIDFHERKILLSVPYFSLGIGEMILGETPMVVSTILGSCISVLIYSKKASVGGMIHYALPDRSYAINSNRNDLNFGDSAIEALFQELIKIQEVYRTDLEAKIVGGASVIEELTHANNIGELNIRVAKVTLELLGVKIVSEETGGILGRKIYFYSDTGRVRISEIPKSRQALGF
jgi:chemotaxis protein CheD